MSFVCKWRIWLHLSGMAVFFPHNCVSLARLYSSVMVMFVGYDCVWCYSICGVRLCLVLQYLLGMNVYVQCDYLSGMIVWYEVICPVWLCLFSVYVRYDSICPIWFCLSQLFVGYDCFCPVWLCLAGMICLSGMTAFVRVYVREIWGIARKCTPDVTMAIFFDVKRKLYFPDAGQKQ